MSLEIKVKFPGGKRVDAVIGDTVIPTDQPVSAGGGGTAPEPFNLFLASIATCAGIYALGFCRARNLSTEGMRLRMLCDFDPMAKRFTKMTLDLTLPEGFPKKYISSIIRSMDMCAVKRHIIEPPEFEVNAGY